MTSLRFRAPGHPLALASLLARVAGGAAPALLRAGAVRLEERVVREGGLQAPPGARLRVELRRVEPPPPARAWRLLARGPGFAAFEAEPGALDLARAAAEASLAATAECVLAPDPAAGGLWLLAEPAAVARLRAALSAAPEALSWRALAVAPAWPAGRLSPPAGATTPVTFSRVALRAGVAELVLAGGDGNPNALCAALAAIGAPLLGDLRHGGVAVEGGLRLRAARLALPGLELELAEPAGWAPVEPVFAAGAEAGEGAELAVSEATLRALARGHPWVLADTETGDVGAFAPGSLVRLRGPAGGAAGLARVEGPGPLAARLWAWGSTRPREARSIEARVADALARRAGLLAPAPGAAATDAFRLIHGEADGLPALFVDRLGPCLRVLLTGRAAEGIQERAIAALVHALSPVLGPDPPRIEVIHLRETPRGVVCVCHRGGKLPPDLASGARLVVQERGLRFTVDPGLARPERSSPAIGLFLDQRENRDRLAACARRGGRWLNLFAHTGAFSVALLAAGADSVASVDLSGAYLRWLEENLQANALAGPRHTTVRADGRRHLERLPPDARFEGIVLDPPTAAAAGRRFWSARRDLPPLVGRALARLAPGGVLLVSRHQRGARGGLAELVQRAGADAGVRLRDVTPAPPGPDFPSLPGFPEGDPFEAVLARRT